MKQVPKRNELIRVLSIALLSFVSIIYLSGCGGQTSSTTTTAAPPSCPSVNLIRIPRFLAPDTLVQAWAEDNSPYAKVIFNPVFLSNPLFNCNDITNNSDLYATTYHKSDNSFPRVDKLIVDSVLEFKFQPFGISNDELMCAQLKADLDKLKLPYKTSLLFVPDITTGHLRFNIYTTIGNTVTPKTAIQGQSVGGGVNPSPPSTPGLY